MDLLWFSGIGWDTPLRRIGWSYVFLATLVTLAGCVILWEKRRDR